MKNLKFDFVLVVLFFVFVQTTVSENGKSNISSDKDAIEIDDLQKRYRLHGKRSNEEDTEQDDDEKLNVNDLEKRYRLYGKRLTDSDAAELEKRYRLYGKRYRLYGKRYRLYGKRDDESNESDDSNEYSRIMKRYRLAGNGTHKRYRLMG